MQHTKNGARVYMRPNGFVLSEKLLLEGLIIGRDQVSRPLLGSHLPISIISHFRLPLLLKFHTCTHDFRNLQQAYYGTAEKNAKGKEGTTIKFEFSPLVGVCLRKPSSAYIKGNVDSKAGNRSILAAAAAEVKLAKR